MANVDRMLGEGIARQELNLLFVIDNSGSMDGEKLGAVNIWMTFIVGSAIR